MTPHLFSSFLMAAVFFLAATSSATAATDGFIFAGCSVLKFDPNSPYESNLNSLLTTMVNAAMYATYNNFTSSAAGGPPDTVSGLFQCRGDLSGGDCARCVARAVSQLGTVCLDSCGGSLQLDGCFVQYDNATFMGVEDTTVLVSKCGPLVASGSDVLTRRDAVLDYLGGSDQFFRVGGSGNVQGVAQCVGDLSPSECQDCLSEAIQRLKTECATSAWGSMYLAKCYARYSEGGSQSRPGNDWHKNKDENDETDKTLAILIGLIAGVTLLIVFLSFLRKACERGGKGGK